MSVPKGLIYQALAKELERWRQMPQEALLLRIGNAPETLVVAIGSEQVSIELTASWSTEQRRAVRVGAVAFGPSHWHTERVEEHVVLPIKEQGNRASHRDA